MSTGKVNAAFKVGDRVVAVNALGNIPPDEVGSITALRQGHHGEEVYIEFEDAGVWTPVTEIRRAQYLD